MELGAPTQQRSVLDWQRGFRWRMRLELEKSLLLGRFGGIFGWVGIRL